MKKSVVFLISISILACAGYIYALNCYYFCNSCGCSYSTPNKCTTCAGFEPGESHYRKIRHYGICSTCRNQGHNEDGDPHGSYSWPDECHGQAGESEF